MYLLSWKYTNPYIAKKGNIVIEMFKYILDTLSTEYTQRAFNYSYRSFTICVQRLWPIQHEDGYNERA